jgi:RNA polymerase sigma-70 factor, ECF subfamily
MDNLSDQEVIESVRRGNINDFSLIVDKYKNKSFTLLKRLLKNNMEAEEVLQDCFLKAYQGLNSFRNESSFSTWFYRIVYNTALTKLSIKKRKIENEMSDINEHFELKSSYDFHEAENEDISKFINNIIDKLPEKYSTVLNLYYLNEMSCEEISAVMNVSVSNVKIILYRSRNMLRDFIIKNNYVKELL